MDNMKWVTGFNGEDYQLKLWTGCFIVCRAEREVTNHRQGAILGYKINVCGVRVKTLYPDLDAAKSAGIKSAQHLLEKALERLDEFIATEPKNLLPEVRVGKEVQ